MNAVWVTATHGGVDHAVSTVELAAALQRGDGRLTGVCGCSFTAASMAAGPDTSCSACARAVRTEHGHARQPTDPGRSRMSVIGYVLSSLSATPSASSPKRSVCAEGTARGAIRWITELRATAPAPRRHIVRLEPTP